jgi:hypothetical protein
MDKSLIIELIKKQVKAFSLFKEAEQANELMIEWVSVSDEIIGLPDFDLGQEITIHAHGFIRAKLKMYGMRTQNFGFNIRNMKIRFNNQIVDFEVLDFGQLVSPMKLDIELDIERRRIK